jgi:dienelactone hydrolase
MQLLIATDIFGSQPEVLAEFRQLSSSCLCVQPYAHQPPVFTDDNEAYRYFLEHGGLEAYSKKLAEVLMAQTEPVFLIGFSAGAAACWINLALDNLPVSHCVAFYGGQIRTLTHLKPLYPTELIFAEETHFSVQDLMAMLAGRPNLKQSLAPFPHGFMNKLSKGYSAEAAGFYREKLKAGYEASL